MMTLALTQVRTGVEREWRRFLSRLPAGDAGAAWDEPTRCAGWSVADLAAHAVWGASMEADALRRYRLGQAGPAQGWTGTPATVDPAAIAERLAVAVDDLLAELAKLGDGDACGLAPLPYGEVPMALFWSILLMEAGVHAGDLPGASADLPADVATATATVLRPFLPVFGAGSSEAAPAGVTVVLRGPTVDLRFQRTGDGWVEAQPAGGTGDVLLVQSIEDSAVLLYALGRLPAGDLRVTVTGPPGTTGAFKRWFPGP